MPINLTHHPFLAMQVSFHAARDDPPLSNLEAAWKARPGAPACEFFQYAKMSHGFCAARADYADAENVHAVQMAIDRSVKFWAGCK